MFHALPRWLVIVLISLPLFLVLLCGGIIVSERISANQRNNRIAQELGLDPAQRLASARHCEIFRCRLYQWFPTTQTLAELEQRVRRTEYQPITAGQPRDRGEQSWGTGPLNRYTRHRFTENGNPDGKVETITWILDDTSGRGIIIYFHPLKESQDIYMFDDQRMQENMVTLIIDQ